MFSIEEVRCANTYSFSLGGGGGGVACMGGRQTCITWIQLHWFESLTPIQHRASPFPNPAHLALTGELIAILGNRGRVEVFESHIAAFEQSEKLVRVRILLDGGGGMIIMKIL